MAQSSTEGLTLKHLEEVWREIHAAAPRGLVSPFANLLAGKRVIEAPPPPPKIQLRDIKHADGTSILSPEFRREMQNWLTARFGYQDDAFKDHAYMFGDNIIIRRDYAQMIRMSLA